MSGKTILNEVNHCKAVSRNSMSIQTIKPMDFPEDENGPVILEYIMMDMSQLNIITRTYVEEFEPKSVTECPVHCINHYDTKEQKEPAIDIAMHPVFMCRDPFRQGRHKLVLCEPQYADKPDKIEYNTRVKCQEFMETVKDHEPWYAFEQEYYVVDKDGVPLDMKTDTKGRPYYDLELNIGEQDALERDLAETQLRACIYAGLKISGMNRECHPSEWEYQVGPLPGLASCDHVIVSRYILQRLAEMNSLHITFTNPVCTRDTEMRCALHLNFSTREMRSENGIEHINKVVENIAKHPQEYFFKYYGSKVGLDMYWFLSGLCYMPKHEEFIANTSKAYASIRIPLSVVTQGKGYIEERRPMADADPYEVCVAFTESALCDTVGFLDSANQ